jgi:hypothetical protein
LSIVKTFKIDLTCCRKCASDYAPDGTLCVHRYGFGLGAARKHTGTTNIAIIKKFCTEQYQMDTTDLSRDQSCVPQLDVVECRISHEDAVKTADEIK